ncbi:hypothetical protein RZR41_30865, partial [Raoultella ornithinolytica]|nr:hypothetical protein [Raoultella ornithinolytica]
MAAFFKNHDSLFSSARKQYDALSAGAALSNTFMAQKLAQDSGVAAFFKNHDSLFSSARKQYDALSA